MTEKRQWQRPELIILVRTRPEEAILAACKLPGSAGAPGPTCDKDPDFMDPPDQCFDLVGT